MDIFKTKIDEMRETLDKIEECTCKKKSVGSKLKKKLKKGAKKFKSYWVEPICKP